MVPILSFKLLPNRNSDGVGASSVRGTSFGGKISDKYYLLMLSPSGLIIPRKVKLSVQILMILDNAPLRTDPWTFFALSGLYYDPEQSFVFAKSLYCIFFTSNSE